ncbi:MAG: carbon-nitrogen hydrolase family protein [Phycisphaerae bacterium]|nr:carbon-nitrogen hydrolase family protein [Phycisphaerae bacterium]
MARIVRIAAAQAPVHERLGPVVNQPLADQQKAYRRKLIEQLVTQAADARADIVCFAEHATTQGIANDPSRRDIWEDVIAGPTAKWAGDLAARCKLYLVLPVKGYIDGQLRNAAIVYDRRGRIIGHYCKVHCTCGEVERGVEPGDSWPVFQADFGTFGVLICHDISFPESARCLALNGAEILFWPTHWGGWGEHHDHIVIASRAIDNAAWVVQVSLAPLPGALWHPGDHIANSGVISPLGQRISNAGQRIGVSVAEVDLDADQRIVDNFSVQGEQITFREAMLGDRRPGTYGAITREK